MIRGLERFFASFWRKNLRSETTMTKGMQKSTRDFDMANQLQETGKTGPDKREACNVERQGWKRWLPAICCGAPLLLLLALPFVGSISGSLATLAGGLLSLAALLACPLGMHLITRMMVKGQK
jgi:hypothetical protein